MKKLYILLFLVMASISSCNALMVSSNYPQAYLTVIRNDAVVFQDFLTSQPIKIQASPWDVCEIDLSFHIPFAIYEPILDDPLHMYDISNMWFSFDSNGGAYLAMQRLSGNAIVNFDIKNSFTITINRY